MSASAAAKLVVGLAGKVLDPAEREWLARYRPAGVILFARNVGDAADLKYLCREISDALPPGGEIVADHEGGAISVLAAALGRPCSPWGLGMIDDVDLTREVHRETAVAAAGTGLTRLLAPCADVLVEPRNPVIGSRAFGSDPRLVSRHVAAAVAGLLEGGVRPCLKHWPGHGGTAVDTHIGAAEPGSRTDEPFRSGLAAGADALLIGHLACQAGEAPATLDPAAAAAARAIAGPGTLLWADDVTMGALRPVLEQRGVAVAGEGLVDPADLPREWLAAVAAGDCERLLCRGIPWRAFPIPDRPATEIRIPGLALPTTQQRAASLSQSVSSGPASAKARSLLAAAAGPLGPGPILWLDLTAGDRWGELDGELWSAADPERMFLRLGPADDPRGHPRTDSFANLVLTSHRPIAEPPDPISGLLAEHGRCVVLGHPSLADEMRCFLPKTWETRALPEATAEGLAALMSAETGPGSG